MTFLILIVFQPMVIGEGFYPSFTPPHPITIFFLKIFGLQRLINLEEKISINERMKHMKENKDFQLKARFTARQKEEIT